MNAISQSWVPLLWTLVPLLAGCSDGASERPRESANNAPLVIAPAPTHSELAATAPIRTEAGGMPTSYAAYYQEASLSRLAEERQQDGRNAKGEYEFHGARLIRYSGSALRSSEIVELEFNLQGALIAARGQSGSVGDDEVAAVRSRANLLRSHALAQQATRSHAQD